MSDNSDENLNLSNSQSRLIEVHHVGVTAKLQSPLSKLFPGLSSTTETDTFPDSKAEYNMFRNETQDESTETTVFSSPRVLYELHAEPEKQQRLLAKKIKPQRIEFQRYCKAKRPHVQVPPRKRKSRTKQAKAGKKEKEQQNSGFFQRLFSSLDNMCKCHPQSARNIIDDLPEPQWNKKAASRHTCIGIYPFEHGCADYLSTTDTHPKINSIVLADRATTYATHFWAEFFGLLHIAVAFVVAFVLQFYRFILYSVVNTLVVGLLHTTSDYMIKPALTVVFNGFLQPPLIFIYNILCSLRDIVDPVADTVNNLMKPLAMLCANVRLINVNYRNVRRLNKDV
ncbi:uncharacterized protein LOC115634379 [Scaptodrosophila lebanonensis]|uniref:Uncharacterized protein LOC115634379 n=1 Tax=Drosophila lebanonensis TaxID=7225 RepID=A0A6J2UKB4_DROLE|nr:uncharacterized protein LOC115634379 [Scaptodrosophila lebanonensis]